MSIKSYFEVSIGTNKKKSIISFLVLLILPEYFTYIPNDVSIIFQLKAHDDKG